MFEVKAAVRGEYAMVLDFYDRLTDGMEHAEFPPGWKKRVYPTEDFLRESIARGELFLGRLDGAPAGVMVLNHISTDGYARVRGTWMPRRRRSQSSMPWGLHRSARAGGLPNSW